jgi:hypothetical protein
LYIEFHNAGLSTRDRLEGQSSKISRLLPAAQALNWVIFQALSPDIKNQLFPQITQISKNHLEKKKQPVYTLTEELKLPVSRRSGLNEKMYFFDIIDNNACIVKHFL